MNDIQKELQQLSPFVAALTRLSPYRVPTGYFDLLPLNIMDRIDALEIAGQHPMLAGAVQLNPFEVPAGYFDHLAGNILSNIRSIEAGSPAEELQALSPILSRMDKKTPFSTPSGYFEELPQDVIAGVNAIDFVTHELESISPLMIAAQSKNVYKVPEDYFDGLSAKVLLRVSTPAAPVVAFNPRKRFVRYAVAAMMAGLMAIGGWIFFQDRRLPAGNELAGIEKISDDEIVHYLDDNTVPIPENVYTASSDLKEDDVKELLTDVSDQELQQYLDQYSIPKIN